LITRNAIKALKFWIEIMRFMIFFLYTSECFFKTSSINSHYLNGKHGKEYVLWRQTDF
jgi:hypothetical protein